MHPNTTCMYSMYTSCISFVLNGKPASRHRGIYTEEPNIIVRHTFTRSWNVTVPQLNLLTWIFEPGVMGSRMPTFSTFNGTGSKFLKMKGDDKCRMWWGLFSKDIKFFFEYFSSSLETYGILRAFTLMDLYI